MTVTHKYSIEVTCEACGSAGAIAVTEQAGPPFTDSPRRDYVDEHRKFAVEGGDPPAIECLACGARFPGAGADSPTDGAAKGVRERDYRALPPRDDHVPGLERLHLVA